MHTQCLCMINKQCHLNRTIYNTKMDYQIISDLVVGLFKKTKNIKDFYKDFLSIDVNMCKSDKLVTILINTHKTHQRQ